MRAVCLALALAVEAAAARPGGGHYDNMTSKSYTQVSCGFFVQPDGSAWAAQDFK